MFGLLSINKPQGITSRAAVDHVKKLVRPAKVGHTGTLDPMATGVLVICIGPATRLASQVQDSDKLYTATFKLGCFSETDDLDSNVQMADNAIAVEKHELASVIPDFIGEIEQVPPAFSAIKVDGKRAYKMARAGEKVTLKPRPIVIKDIQLVDFKYPEFTLRVECGAGTYIRSLGRDLAIKLGTRAVMTKLVRDRVGTFLLKDALSIDNLIKEKIETSMVDPIELLPDLQHVVMHDQEIGKLNNGCFFSADEVGINEALLEFVAVNSKGQLLACMERRADGLYKPKLNFVHYYQFQQP
ncbi:MAG: tRNA pseudouridine(55) synthase TruB [Planctomycetota bacterium]